MPELPEVETVLRGVAPRLVGRTVARVIVRDRRLRVPVADDFGASAKGQTISGATRRGKWIVLHWRNGGALIHLGMTGALSVRRNPPREKHEHLALAMDDGAHLVFRDPRRFGRVECFRGEAESHPTLAALGPEPLSRNFNGETLRAALSGRSVAVKPALMNGAIVAGVGNIYASESLFAAGVHPQTPAGNLRAKQCDALARAVKQVLRAAVRAGGSTLRDYVNGEGEPGRFQMKWKVYNRAALPCRRCGAAIRKTVVCQRATYHCPRCQRRQQR